MESVSRGADHDHFCRRQAESAKKIRKSRLEEKAQACKEAACVQTTVSDAYGFSVANNGQSRTGIRARIVYRAGT
jgi:hypothetical protein